MVKKLFYIRIKYFVENGMGIVYGKKVKCKISDY